MKTVFGWSQKASAASNFRLGALHPKRFLSLGAGASLFLTAHSALAATFNVADGDVPGLIGAITTANSNGQNDTINLAAGGTYTLTTVNNSTKGPNGLPIITFDFNFNTGGAHSLDITGNGATLQRSTAGGTPEFRILQISGATVNISSLTIANGEVRSSSYPDYFGGGIHNSHGTLTLTNCILTGNGSFSGGGIYTNGFSDGSASLIMSNCTVSGNAASGSGGGIDNLGGTLTMSNCTINSNTAGLGQMNGGYGGGIVNIGGGLTVQTCTISGNNVGTGYGAGIYNQAATATVRNSTILGNNASQGGQCIWDASGNGGSATLILSNNILKRGAQYSSTNLHNNSFGGGTAATVSDGYNLSSDNGSGFLNSVGEQLNTDSQLDPAGLQNNGGPSKTTRIAELTLCVPSLRMSAPAARSRLLRMSRAQST